MDILSNALKKAFIDKSVISKKLNPKFIINDPEKNDYFLTLLQNDLTNCSSFFISVAFITQSGLDAIKTQIADLASRGISGKILTSTYLGFNNPDVFQTLLQIPNVEVRISKKQGFHSKGYLFDMGSHQTFIIGSSNLTMNALKINYEWNIKLNSYDNGELLATIQNHLSEEWEQAEKLTNNWLAEFKKIFRPEMNIRYTAKLMVADEKADSNYILPNKMQKLALENLRLLREEKKAKKGLVISATGTGKTYLAAFDVAQSKPNRVLFVVHREQILKKSMESFKKVLGGNDEDFGMLSGTEKKIDAKYLFATIQTISKEGYYTLFEQNVFDYILIDEVHKAGAASYNKIIDYFQPQFLLGMTATPERSDGFNIFELFDYNIAYEIRLQEALEEDFLCPFHYFAVTDYEKDGSVIHENSSISQLTNEQRVQFLINKLNYYGCSGNNPKGLVFCSRKEEAKQLATQFNIHGISSSYLSGEDAITVREKEIRRLENGEINYIFTVDVFNEGIDIPKVNQIVMLRSTESSIIFIQQLGRGLRKDSSKEFVTVVDFIGNYKNNYMIPIALSGDNSRNKNNVRRDTIDSTYIKGLSLVNFERVAKERIFRSIDQAKLDSFGELKNEYFRLKNRLNTTPFLEDFQRMGSVEPSVIIRREKTYYHFLKKLGENDSLLSSDEENALKFLSNEFITGIRPHELIIMLEIISNKRSAMTFEEINKLLEQNNLRYDDKMLETIYKVLDSSFYVSTVRSNYNNIQLFITNRTNLEMTQIFKDMMKNEYFSKLVVDTLIVGLNNAWEFDSAEDLTLYKRYRRKDALRALNMVFNQNEQSIGGYTYSNNHFVVFVTLDKGEDFKAAQMAYEDEFLDPSRFKWFTKSPRTIDSPEVKLLRSNEDWNIHLFVKRRYSKKDNEIEFYYLGEMFPDIATIKQMQKMTTQGIKRNVVEMEFNLKETIEPNMYEFLTGE